MKTLNLVVAILALVVYSSSAVLAQSTDKIVGYWEAPEKDGIIEIYKKADNTYAGQVRWAVDNYKDVHNENPNLRNRRVTDIEFLQGFTAEGNTLTGGTVYDARSGNTYSCKIWLNSDGSLSLRGYLGFSLLGKTEVMTRPAPNHVGLRGLK